MPDPLVHRRTHSLLLLQKLLSLKPGASPLTLVLDSLEQSARPVVAECVARAKANKSTTIILSFEHTPPPPGVDHAVSGHRKDAAALRSALTSLLPPSAPALIIIDTIHPLLSLPVPLSALLPSLAATPSTSLLLVYHTDVPLPLSPSLPNPYAPSPLTLLTHLATTLIRPVSLPHALAAHRAAQRSLVVPPHGLQEEADGVLQSLDANGGSWRADGVDGRMDRGVVLDVEHRRRSGRAVSERAFLALPESAAGVPRPQKLVLLEEHPLFAAPAVERQRDEDPACAAGTFSLTLTERQRREREGVVLPYYDAQNDDGVGGWGEGGRILYQMGAEDAADWDSEEDEL